MPSLDNTDAILPLGALFLAGSSQKGRKFTGGEGGKQYLAGGFAASSSNYAVDRIRNAAGLSSDQVPDALAQAVLGMGLSRYGGMIPQNKAMARGIHYNVAAESFNQMGVTLGDLMEGNGGSSATTSGVSRSSVSTPSMGNHTRGDNATVY